MCVCGGGGGGELWCINSGDLVKSTTIMTNLEMWLAVKYTNKYFPKFSFLLAPMTQVIKPCVDFNEKPLSSSDRFFH